MTAAPEVDRPPDRSLVLIQLFKGPIYRDTHERLWDPLLRQRAAVSDYVAALGLQVEIDETDGYAFLRSRPDSAEQNWPRLVVRRTLPFRLSLLLALLRKRLAEHDAMSAEARLILTREQIVEMLHIYLPDRANEARLADDVVAQVEKAIELGYLHRLPGDPPVYEVRRILRAFVDGQWLHDFDARLGEYLADATEAERLA